MEVENRELKQRILEISYNHKLSHLGSNLTAVDIIYEIFQQKKPEERFVLSSGHAGLALYTVLEAMGGRNAEEIFLHHGIHPDRCLQCGLDCSTGSLGQGLPIALGMALSDRAKNVYCLISDGECSEGSIWEGLNVARNENLKNLKVYANLNGWGAYSHIPKNNLSNRLKSFYREIHIKRTNTNQLPFLNGLEAHYKVMSEDDYELAQEILK